VLYTNEVESGGAGRISRKGNYYRQIRRTDRNLWLHAPEREVVALALIGACSAADFDRPPAEGRTAARAFIGSCPPA